MAESTRNSRENVDEEQMKSNEDVEDCNTMMISLVMMKNSSIITSPWSICWMWSSDDVENGVMYMYMKSKAIREYM